MSRPDDIAVIGLGLRFPGGATSPQELWTVLENQQSQWSPFPEDRLNIDGYYHPSSKRQGGISFKGAHFLKEDVASFDAAFFGIPSEEAVAVDPQQRMLLEVSYEALENAGIRKEDVDGSDCSVFVGSFVKDYEQICLRDPDWSAKYAATGNGIAIMANRISYAFNLHGPSMTLDTGCSASLIAVHLAAQTLRTGESSLAIAAGAGLILSPNTIMPMMALNFLSPDGKCFTFDSRANGYGRGEGIGAVILKRLSDAVRDNDTIHAVIRSSSTNQDGRTAGITLPSKEAQIANIRNAYAIAGLDYSQTAYVECHGTGTQAGDWRELKAISETIAAGRPADHPVVVGSLKPNIGHLEGAAGIAGLIKGVLTLERGKIPPQINFKEGNPNIDFETWGVKVPTETLDWPLPGLRRVSVNCFGFGGSNAHVILDEAPGYLSSRGLKGNHSSIDEAPPAPEEISSHPHLFLYSANDKGGVARVVNSQLPVLDETKHSVDFLTNYAYTLGSRRSNLDWKGFVVADSMGSLRSKLEQFDASSPLRSSAGKMPRLGFLFCGQGSQWAQMGKDLMSYGMFNASLTAASMYLKEVLGSPFDLLEELFKDPPHSRISKPDISQPATTAVQCALVDLLYSFNILPDHVVGHSSGEIAAAYATGALPIESAWTVAYYRGLAASSIPVRAPKLRGGMAVLGMSVEETDKYLTSVAKSASVACINGPRSVTISGLSNAIRWIANDLKEKKTFCKVLNVKTAYHSSHMKLVEYDYKESLGLLPVSDTHANVSMFSTVTGELARGTDLDAEYWARNLVSPVQYVAAIESMMSLPPSERPEILIEVSPTASLRSPTLDILASGKSSDAAPKYLSVLERSSTGPESLLNMIGELWTRGYPIDMDSVVSRGISSVPLKCLSDLPTYPWDHSKRYWFETHLSRANRFRKYPRQDLIGFPTADSVPFEPRWRGFLRISESPWIQDHQVQKTIIYPAAGMISMVLEGAKQMAAENVSSTAELLGYELLDLTIGKAMLIPHTDYGLEVALNIRSDASPSRKSDQMGSYDFAIYSKSLDKDWERHVTGKLRFKYKLGDWKAGFKQHQSDYHAVEARCVESLIPRQLYETLDSIGLNYGPCFRNLVEVRTSKDSTVSKVRIPDTKSKMPAQFEYPHLLHPATLDAMFHPLLADSPSPMVPVAIKRVFVSAGIQTQAGSVFTGHSTARIAGIRGAEADIVMRQSDGEDANFVIIDGLRLTRLTSSSSSGTPKYLANHRNLSSQMVWKQDAAFASPSSIVEQLDILAHKYPSLSILQVGADSALTAAILGVVSPNKSEAPRLSRLTIVSPNDSDELQSSRAIIERSSVESIVETVADVSDVQATYNLIIVGHVSTATGLRSLLQPGGILLEKTEPGPLENPTAERPNGWRETSSSGDEMRVKAFQNKLPPSGEEPLRDAVFIVPSDASDTEVGDMIAAIQERIGANSQPVIRMKDLHAIPELVSGRVVISLVEASVSENREYVFNWAEQDFAAFRTLQGNARAILWVTRGANMVPLNPRGAPILGLSRTLMSEDPLKLIVTLDLSLDSRLVDPDVVQSLLSVFNASFETKSGPGPREVEYAERNGKLYIPRLTPIAPLNRIIEGENLGNIVNREFGKKEGDDSGLELVASKLGTSEDDMVCFSEFEPRGLAEDEVEIAFVEAPLCFLDVETILGRTTDSSIGLDVRGIVKRVGSAVSGLAAGDEVTALVAGDTIRNTLNVKARLAKRNIPNFIPSILISAYYALFHVGRLSRGRQVLIQAGASSYGLAAIELSQSAGVEVFATVLGPDADDQRAVLEKRGIPQDHILDGERGDFVDALLAFTNGQGVDVVYNPTLRPIDTNTAVIRRCGSIVSFVDKSPAPQTRTSVSISSSMTVVNFDLRCLIEHDIDFVGDLFDQVSQLFEGLFFETGSLSKRFDVQDVKDAISHIHKSPFIGLTSVVANLNGRSSVPVLHRDISKSLNAGLNADSTYLLSGGLGGLGKSITELLVSNGARHIAYLSRSGATSEGAASYIADLQSRGVDARAFAVDICDSAAVEGLIKETIIKEMPPIQGIFQCAAVIRDAVFDNMTFEDWDAAVKPKMVGSWNLHQAMNATGQDPFYIFLSSSAGVIGNRGQANYASGNCFQDALARHLRLLGKQACSLDLGPILGAGMLAENDALLDILRASGFYGIRHGDFLKVVEHAVTGEMGHGIATPAQVTLAIGTGGIINQNQPADPYWSRTAAYSYLNLVDLPLVDMPSAGNSSHMDIKSMLARAADTEAATAIVSTGLAAMLAKSMNLHSEDVDVDRPPSNYGVDSLVAVSVRNWVLGTCGVQISVFEILGDSTILQLSRLIAEKCRHAD